MSEDWESTNGKNYCFWSSNAYTEDGILVYNISISNVPIEMTVDELLTHFRQFGTVSKIHLMPAKGTGFVNFADFKAAAKALQSQFLIISPHKERIELRACESWHQPQFNGNGEADDTDTKRQKLDVATLLQLNDDCLAHIFKLLDLPDKMYLAVSHPRLTNVLQLYYAQEFQMFAMWKLDKMTLWQTREFFRLFNGNIKTLGGQLPFCNQKRIVDYIGLCGNLCNLKLYASPVTSEMLSTVLQPKITELYLDNCDLNDECIDVMAQQLPNLRALGVPYNTKLEGKFLNRLTWVEQLDIECCRGILPNYLLGAVQSFKVLKVLNVVGCDKFAKMNFELLKMLVNQRAEQLCVLAIDSLSVQWAVLLGSLTQLKQLTCANSSHLTNNFIRELARLKCLEQLNIMNLALVTDAALLHLVTECTNLRKLNMIGYSQITNQFIYNAIAALNDSPVPRTAPLVIELMFDDGITRSVLSDPRYIDAKSVLQLSYKEQHFRV